ncbi:MAG TPA: dienelactone hydrolase family protein [Chthonomonadales bacterium]|nr:dienelactone hydrolase family protein [Chthonomonadales bacterium]
MSIRTTASRNQPFDSSTDPALDPDLDRLSRRDLLGRASAAVVCTSAVSQQPAVRALEDTSIEKEEVTYPSQGGGGTERRIQAFLAVPKTAGKRGSVIVIHEIFGLTDHIKDVTCRLAQAGFTALGVNLFTREGAPPPTSGGFAPLMQFVSAIPDRQILDDLKAAMAYLRALSNGKVGVVGFCWGGRISMLLDASAPDLNAAVAYYGRISGEKTANQPAFPIDVVAQMRAPLLGHFGAQDTGIPPAEANKLREALKAHHKTAEIFEYQDAGHAFNNDTRESYRPAAAHLAWQRTLDWFRKYLD